MPSEQAPPSTPTDLKDIDDAVRLLGQVAARGNLCLNMYMRERLTRYCERMPDSKRQAHRWKIYLRALRKEVVAEREEE